MINSGREQVPATIAAVPAIPWWAGGIAIGLVLIVAVGLVQPIGVSTQYVVLDGVLLHALLPTVAAQSPYLAETAEGWTVLTYEFMFVLGIPLGAMIAVPLGVLCLWMAMRLPEPGGLS